MNRGTVNTTNNRWNLSWPEEVPSRNATLAEIATVPPTIGEQVDAATLMSWVDEAVAEFLPEQALAGHAHNLPSGSRELTSVLSFAYARRILSSAEISRRCGSETVFRLLCDGKVPFANELITFRRRHGCLLEMTLSKVLLRAMQHNLPWGANSASAQVRQRVQDEAVARLDTARQIDTEAD